MFRRYSIASAAATNRSSGAAVNGATIVADPSTVIEGTGPSAVVPSSGAFSWFAGAVPARAAAHCSAMMIIICGGEYYPDPAPTSRDGKYDTKLFYPGR